MKTPIIITDVTRMRGKRVCIAGYNSHLQCIRPICDEGIQEDWLYIGTKPVVRPFSEIELELLEPRHEPPHTEDYWYDPAYKRAIRLLTPCQRNELLQRTKAASVSSIFGTNVHHDNGFFVSEGTGLRSLGTIQIKTIVQVVYNYAFDRWDYRISFYDQQDGFYSLRITDLTFRYYVDHLYTHNGGEPEEISQKITGLFKKDLVFLRIGLARGWDRFPDRCYLQITGIYTFPDYVFGKSFADFAPYKEGR